MANFSNGDHHCDGSGVPIGYSVQDYYCLNKIGLEG
jgi:hypothetical protein